MAYHRETAAGGFGGRAASSAGKPASQVKAGPFDVSPALSDTTTTMSDALITGLLIVYPVAATVAAVVVGLFIAGPSV
ncbi:MAG: hypothetical protein NTV73_18355 [Hyphomicrobiales bacterium]|nr:hypothetical protein [Hyphomicrobiales bacterium]